MNVTLDRVETALAALWDEAARSGPTATHARTANLLAVCESADQHPSARAVLTRLLPRHPGRALLVVPYDPAAPSPSLTASVELVVDTQRRNEPVAEAITLDYRGDARRWLPNAVERLLSPGAPTFLWWLGDLPDEDTLFDKLAALADVALFDSSAMDLRDLRTLARLLEWSRGAYALGDLAWARLRSWQDLLARFFDDPAACALLPEANELLVRTTPPREGPVREPTSTQGALLAGWLATRLGARAGEVRWSDATATLPRGDGVFTVRFEQAAASEPAEGTARVPPGALVHVELRTASGARFVVAREPDDAETLGWFGACAGAVLPHAVWRSRLPDDDVLLARALDALPDARALFAQSLRAAAALAEGYHRSRP